MPMTRIRQNPGREPKVEAAQDDVFAWLKKHIVTLPRSEASFLTEAEVCRATGMSRTPVREALLRMEADGFPRILPKKGGFRPIHHGGRSRADHAGPRAG
jgi:DNA-binding GntR family transcriptional regulator